VSRPRPRSCRPRSRRLAVWRQHTATGIVDTRLIYRQMADQFEDIDEMRRRRNAASPMGGMGDAWDVAHAAAFLASDDAKYITGGCLPVDAGKGCAGR
jgi:NAD(P)-dependent dehydrogenase (short-subunit alcohol dehydrogenase family)